MGTWRDERKVSSTCSTKRHSATDGRRTPATCSSMALGRRSRTASTSSWRPGTPAGSADSAGPAPSTRLGAPRRHRGDSVPRLRGRGGCGMSVPGGCTRRLAPRHAGSPTRSPPRSRRLRDRPSEAMSTFGACSFASVERVRDLVTVETGEHGRQLPILDGSTAASARSSPGPAGCRCRWSARPLEQDAAARSGDLIVGASTRREC